MKPQPITSIGSPTSFFARSLRSLTANGSPLSPPVMLFFKSTDELLLPFGMMTETKNNRLCFWPPLPTDIATHQPDGTPNTPDHFTLEHANEQTHVTAYYPDGNPYRFPKKGKLKPHPDSGLSEWVSLMVRWKLVEEQDHQVEVTASSHPDDKNRREDEFKKAAEVTTVGFVKLPDGKREGDYVFCTFYIQTGSTFDLAKVTPTFLYGRTSNMIDGFPDGTKFVIQPSILKVGSTTLVVLAATPQGTAKMQCGFGFPITIAPPSSAT